MNRTSQKGVGLINLVIFVFVLAFLVGAFHFRLHTTNMSHTGDLIFRIVMLIYFALTGYKFVPLLAAWINKQEFMIEAFEKDKNANDHILEYFLLALTVLFWLLLSYALFTGSMSDVNRYGSQGDFDSLTQTADFWTNALAAYFITFFVSTIYWQMHLHRHAK